MFCISKEFHFSAAHALTHLPPSHKCHRQHGHNYRVIVRLHAPTLNKDGMVIDYGMLSPIKSWIDETLDHQDLNKVLDVDGECPLGPTTAEVLAFYIYSTFADTYPQMYEVEVQETPKASATYVGPRKDLHR